MKNTLITLGLALAVGCSSTPVILEERLVNPVEPPVVLAVSQPEQKVSYKLEDLCDTEITEKDLTLYVSIDKSEKLWDYHDYRDELFGYVTAFFAQYKVNCKLIFLDSGRSFDSANEFGVEVLTGDKRMVERYTQLFLPKTDAERLKIKMELSGFKGRAVPEKGMALINGYWEEFRHDTSRKDKKWFSEPYKGMTVKEYIIRNNADNICHEVLHCMGLWHPGTFRPLLVSSKRGEIPNVLSYYPPEFSEKLPIGSELSSLQVKLMHSYVTGQNTYKAFLDSKKDLDVFLERIAGANSTKVRKY
jgi:hypothetical protein